MFDVDTNHAKNWYFISGRSYEVELSLLQRTQTPCIMIKLTQKENESYRPIFYFSPESTNLKKKKKKDISNWANPFKEQEDLPDSWSILIERAGLWGAESSLKE